MSILSELGKILGARHKELLLQIIKNNTKVNNLEQDLLELKSQVNQMQITGSFHTNDITISKNKGVVLEAEDYTRYRLRITADKKLIVDDVTNGDEHIGEINLKPPTSGSGEIGDMTIGEDFTIQ